MIKTAASRLSVAEAPHALENFGGIERQLDGRQPFPCLDYDGTLTPIVSSPEEATLDEAARDALRRLVSAGPVAIVSGRALEDVRALVGLDQIYCAGSHGYKIQTPGGETLDLERAWACYPLLNGAETELRKVLRSIPGATVECKKFAVAVHYRKVPDGFMPEVRRAVGAVSRNHPGLRLSTGKKIFEFRPEFDWDKGKAVRKLAGLIDSGPRPPAPVYIGDDTTDEDAFAEVQTDGIGIIVRDRERIGNDTAASYALDSPSEVRQFLDRLAGVEQE